MRAVLVGSTQPGGLDKIFQLRDESFSGGTYAWDKNTKAKLCAKNAGGLMYIVSCYHILYKPRSQALLALPLLSGESLGMKLMLYHLTIYCYYSPYVLEPIGLNVTMKG